MSNIKILQEHCSFRIGDYVIVNNRDYGYMIAIKNNNVEIKVKYAITNVIQDINVYDCQIASIVNNTNLRSGLERHVRTAPSILPNNITRRLLSPTERISLTPIQKLKAAIQSARSWKMEEKENKHPLIKYFKGMNEVKEKGWIRIMLNTDKKESKQLTGTGKGLLLIIYNMFLGLPNKGTTFGRISAFGKAIGVTETRLRQLFEEYLERDFSTERKTRSDKGQTVFNSDKKKGN